jgi:phosphosulfolactate synthase
VNRSSLTLPDRGTQPRAAGLTMVVDGGLALRALDDLVRSAGEYLDYVKLGWGTAVVSGELEDKLDLLRDADIDFYFGGTLFEKHVLQGRFDDFRFFCQRFGCRRVEVSNGTICLSNHEKAGYIEKLSVDFEVISEVGFKDPTRSEHFSAVQWLECIGEDLDAGATLVTLEARESGKSGICRPDGNLRVGLVEELLSGQVCVDRLLFEAPTTALQAYLISRVGPNVNLGNVAPAGVIGLETLRLGLRADTLLAFEEFPH